MLMANICVAATATAATATTTTIAGSATACDGDTGATTGFPASLRITQQSHTIGWQPQIRASRSAATVWFDGTT